MSVSTSQVLLRAFQQDGYDKEIHQEAERVESGGWKKTESVEQTTGRNICAEIKTFLTFKFKPILGTLGVTRKHTLDGISPFTHSFTILSVQSTNQNTFGRWEEARGH